MKPVSIEEILARKREEIAELRADRTWSGRPRIRERRSFRAALAKPGLSVIAEIKRSSPSTGDLGVDIDALLAAYISAGVDALSILTDSHFRMSAGELERLAKKTDLPILRKDFTLSKEQIDEACILGADAILLIATFLPAEELAELGAHAEALGLDVLYEAHAREDLLKIPREAGIIGINNRNLAAGDYRTDTGLSQELHAMIPEGVIRVAESGYEKAAEVPAGYDAVLIGTGLIRKFKRGGSDAVAAAILQFPASSSTLDG